MDWLTTLRRSGGINALSRQLGASPADVASAATALLPALLGGLRQAAESFAPGDAGVQALVDVLAGLGGGQLAADIMGPGPIDTTPGNLLLDRVMGPEVARRAVLAEAERSQGLDMDLGARVLPGLAMLVGGYITARAGGSGAEGSGGLEELGGLRDTVTPDVNDNGSDRI